MRKTLGTPVLQLCGAIVPCEGAGTVCNWRSMSCGRSFFFGRRASGAALAEISGLLGAIAVTLIVSWRESRVAGLLLFLYPVWNSFAAYLNARIRQLNRK